MRQTRNPDIRLKSWKAAIKKMIFPNRLLIFILISLSVVLLAYSLGDPDAKPAVQYLSYVLSFYTLVCVCARVPEIVRSIRGLLYGNEMAAKYLREKQVRDVVALHTGTGVDFIFAVFKFVTAVWFRSYWLMAEAVYHMILSVMHAILLAKIRKSRKYENVLEKRLKQLESFRLCGIMMVFLNLAMSGMLFLMIWEGHRRVFPGSLVYAFAFYAFYCVIIAAVQVVKYRRMENPIFSASKSIRMAKAMMSLFTLQTVLLTQFGGEMSAETEMMMNILTGGSVCAIVITMAVLMIRKANREIKQLKKEFHS